ncbi:hypothetical protein HAX54_003659, partial [Datura stramonium]|nr:hypothetical protein [Datura stramonium]
AWHARVRHQRLSTTSRVSERRSRAPQEARGTHDKSGAKKARGAGRSCVLAGVLLTSFLRVSEGAGHFCLHGAEWHTRSRHRTATLAWAMRKAPKREKIGFPTSTRKRKFKSKVKFNKEQGKA